jgi:hypothetical protein
MPYPDDPGQTLVSLRDLELAGEPALGHLALGVLVASDRAVFDLPTDLVIGDDARLEVLVSPTAPGDTDVIEHIRPLQVLVRSLETTPRARVALVPLAQDSRYGAALPKVDQADFASALERTGEIWAALIELRVVRAPLRDVDPSRVLNRIVEIELRQRADLMSVVLARPAHEIANCPFSNNTECGHGGFITRRTR